MECILGTIVIFATSMLQDGNKEFVLIMTVIYGLVINPRYFLLFTLQGTNLIKEYAKIIILDRVVYCAATAVVLLCGGRDFKLLIYADIFARMAGDCVSHKPLRSADGGRVADGKDRRTELCAA